MNAKIITAFNQKGGCDKTTASMYIAGTLSLRGSKALLVGMDKQGTATRWAVRAPEDRPFPASVIGLALSGDVMHRGVREFVADYDYIMVDCPPAVHSPSSSNALLISGVALISAVLSPLDLWAAVATKALAQQTQVTNETFRIRILANMVQRRVSLTRRTIEVLGDDGDIPLMDSMIDSHLAFRECQAIGATVHGVPGAQEAMNEADLLIDEVLQLLQEERI